MLVHLNILRRRWLVYNTKHKRIITNQPSTLPVLAQRFRTPSQVKKILGWKIFSPIFFSALYTLHNNHACAIPVVVTTRCNRVQLPLSLSLSRSIRGMRGISINSRNQKRRSGRGSALCAPLPPPLRSTLWTDTPLHTLLPTSLFCHPDAAASGFVMLKMCRYMRFPVFADCILLIYDPWRN